MHNVVRRQWFFLCVFSRRIVVVVVWDQDQPPNLWHSCIYAYWCRSWIMPTPCLWILTPGIAHHHRLHYLWLVSLTNPVHLTSLFSPFLSFQPWETSYYFGIRALRGWHAWDAKSCSVWPQFSAYSSITILMLFLIPFLTWRLAWFVW